MDEWNSWFATTGSELEVQDAVLALERLIVRAELDPPTRDAVEAALEALRRFDGSPAAGAPVAPAGPPATLSAD